MIGRLTHDIIAPNPAGITKFKEINATFAAVFCLARPGGKRAVQSRFRIGAVA
jgi:hypothetical protein